MQNNKITQARAQMQVQSNPKAIHTYHQVISISYQTNIHTHEPKFSTFSKPTDSKTVFQNLPDTIKSTKIILSNQLIDKIISTISSKLLNPKLSQLIFKIIPQFILGQIPTLNI